MAREGKEVGKPSLYNNLADTEFVQEEGGLSFTPSPG